MPGVPNPRLLARSSRQTPTEARVGLGWSRHLSVTSALAQGSVGRLSLVPMGSGCALSITSSSASHDRGLSPFPPGPL